MKYYLDTSSLAKIYHDEEGSSHALELYQSNAVIAVSELAVLEFISTGAAGGCLREGIFGIYRDQSLRGAFQRNRNHASGTAVSGGGAWG